MTKNLKFACLASASAALVIGLPLARTAKINPTTGIEKASRTNAEDGASRQRAQNAVKFATNGPYRDGWFQGKLAASENIQLRVPLGRWTAQADRDAFATGYQDGYAQAHAENKPPVPVQ